jgi:hypothetical protein
MSGWLVDKAGRTPRSSEAAIVNSESVLGGFDLEIR